MKRRSRIGLALATVLALGGGLFGGGSAAAYNPFALSVAIENPYISYAEISLSCNTLDPSRCYNPSRHHTPWLGDWATDLWRDNRVGGVDDPNVSCNQRVSLKASNHLIQGGNRPDNVMAKLLESRNACDSGNYEDGGVMQKWEIWAYYNGVGYPLGWVLYAHLDRDTLVYNTIGTWVSAYNTYLGRTFEGGASTSCWGGCHTHIEFKNYDHKACWNIYPPYIWIPTTRTVGLIGGYSSTARRCQYVE